MSEENDDSKQEEPTERRKEDAAKKGQVVYSKEVSAGVALIAQIGVLAMTGGGFLLAAYHFLFGMLGSLRAWPGDQLPIFEVFIPLFRPGAIYLAIFFATAFFSSIVGHIMQKGFEPRPEAAAPDASKIDPIEGMKKVFSKETLIMLFKNLVKTLGLLFVAYLSIRPNLSEIMMASQFPMQVALSIYAGVFSRLIIHCLIFVVALAGIDYFINYKMLMKKLMMSRQELKDEMKETEGNPQIKQKVRQIQYKRAKRDIEQNVPQATLIVTNPTHYAVAIYYKKGETPVPRLTAKGVDALALKVREIAKAHRVPIIENPPLARALYRDVKSGKEIPSRYYKAVAKLIATILRLEEQKKMQQTRPVSQVMPGFMR